MTTCVHSVVFRPLTGAMYNDDAVVCLKCEAAACDDEVINNQRRSHNISQDHYQAASSTAPYHECTRMFKRARWVSGVVRAIFTRAAEAVCDSSLGGLTYCLGPCGCGRDHIPIEASSEQSFGGEPKANDSNLTVLISRVFLRGDLSSFGSAQWNRSKRSGPCTVACLPRVRYLSGYRSTPVSAFKIR